MYKAYTYIIVYNTYTYMSVMYVNSVYIIWRVNDLCSLWGYIYYRKNEGKVWNVQWKENVSIHQKWDITCTLSTVLSKNIKWDVHNGRKRFQNAYIT